MESPADNEPTDGTKPDVETGTQTPVGPPLLAHNQIVIECTPVDAKMSRRFKFYLWLLFVSVTLAATSLVLYSVVRHAESPIRRTISTLFYGGSSNLSQQQQQTVGAEGSGVKGSHVVYSSGNNTGATNNHKLMTSASTDDFTFPSSMDTSHDSDDHNHQDHNDIIGDQQQPTTTSSGGDDDDSTPTERPQVSKAGGGGLDEQDDELDVSVPTPMENPERNRQPKRKFDSNAGGNQISAVNTSGSNNLREPEKTVGGRPVGGRPNTTDRPARPNSSDSREVCVSPGCVRAAAQILGNMDTQANPCEDFYQYSCGRWVDTQVIPDEKSSLSVFSQNTADLNLKLRALIESKTTPQDPPIVGQMRNLYASCMNLSDIEARGVEPLVDVLKFLGGWPVVSWSSSSSQSRLSGENDAREKNFDWLATIIKIRERGFSHDMIIDLSVVPDVRNSRRYIIDLDQSSLGLPDRSYYFKGMDDTTVAAYFKLMVESAVMLGAPRSESTRRQMTEVLEFEIALARISLPRDQRRNVTRMYNKMLARDLYSLAPNIDWRKYLTSLLRDDSLDLDKDEVVVKVPSFLKSLDSLLQQTKPKTIANYMMWRIVRNSMNGLGKTWRELAHSYSTVTTGRQVEEPRWEQCLGSLDGTLGAALSAMYVKNHFNKQSKEKALDMVEYIKDEFIGMLKKDVDWMDGETREEAIVKAKSISPYIGYPDELLQDELIEELYSGLRMNRVNYYQNTRNLRRWSTDYAFSQLRKPNKRGDWKKHARAAVVNAYYNSLENSIEFPAGILQGAFFDADRPNYMNFGAIGYVIGHEITHGFDDRGRQFDREGNDRNWWKPKTDAKFKERAQCIIEQYGNYIVPENGLKINGFNTQGENIADNGGIKQAFRAYRRWSKDNLGAGGQELRLPGLDLTPDQLFWVSAANIWCGKFRAEVLKLRINSGVHSPSRFRIIGPLSNSPEFSQSFGCPVGSPMNPRKKCAVW